MIKIRLLSDLHLEFHANGGRTFIESLDCTGVDILVLAGDISTVPGGLLNALTWLAQRYPEVVMVAGNHELYRSDRASLNTTLQKAMRRNVNLHCLDNQTVTLAGQRFIGTTLWFPETHAARSMAHQWADFACIPTLHRWVYQANADAVRFLHQTMQPGDVVVTHHCPSFRSVDIRYVAHPTNCYFVSDIEPLIIERQPALVCHGHTHCSMDYQIGPTRVLCNPFGYLRQDENPRFNERLVAELP